MLQQAGTVKALALELEWTLEDLIRTVQKEDWEVVPSIRFENWADSLVMILLNITDMLSRTRTLYTQANGSGT